MANIEVATTRVSNARGAYVWRKLPRTTLQRTAPATMTAAPIACRAGRRQQQAEGRGVALDQVVPVEEFRQVRLVGGGEGDRRGAGE
ncbi:hypothetical protein ACFP3U_23790 [Kitasatospora misakiensis]|uniref:Uncharacterized protein n=1 Tax=Kitasatospora misakiensis TaxID=67330 RepID=A0ABW0X7Y9_9ACTN